MRIGPYVVGTCKPDPMGEPRNGFHILWLVVAVLSGAGMLAAPNQGRVAVIAELPAWARVTWAVMMLTGGLACLGGMFWPWDIRDGLLAKRFGYWALAVASLVYMLDALFVGAPAWFATGVAAGFLMACVSRARRVGRVIKRAIEAS